MPEKHRGVIDFRYSEGAFRPLSPSEPFQLLRLYEFDSASKKKQDIELENGEKLLLLCTAGQGVIKCEKECSISIEEQSVVFISAAGKVEFLALHSNVTLRCICLLFSVFDHESLFYSTELSSPARFFLENTVLYTPHAIEVHRVMNDLLLELSLSHPTMLLVKGLFYQLLITAYRRLIHHVPAEDFMSVSMHAVGHTVYAIVRYIDDHLFSLNNLMDMAQELGYSYNYLSHLFRKKTGMTIQTYVRKKKIEQSKILLLDHQYSVTEIATMLNYDCIQSFSKAFRRATNMSPSEFRSKNI